MGWAAVPRNAGGVALPLVDNATDAASQLAQLAQNALQQAQAAVSENKKRGNTCTLENIKVRQEWYSSTQPSSPWHAAS